MEGLRALLVQASRPYLLGGFRFFALDKTIAVGIKRFELLFVAGEFLHGDVAVAVAVHAGEPFERIFLHFALRRHGAETALAAANALRRAATSE